MKKYLIVSVLAIILIFIIFSIYFFLKISSDDPVLYYEKLYNGCTSTYTSESNELKDCLGSVDYMKTGGYKLARDSWFYLFIAKNNRCSRNYHPETNLCVGCLYTWCEPND